MSSDSAKTPKQTTADLVARDLKNDAIWLRVMVDGSDVALDRDSAERLWPETRDNLCDIADALEAIATENARLRGIEERAKIEDERLRFDSSDRALIVHRILHGDANAGGGDNG